MPDRPQMGGYDQFTLYVVANVFCVILLILILFTSKRNFKNALGQKVLGMSIIALLIMFIFDSVYAAIDLGRIPNANIDKAYFVKNVYFALGLIAGYGWYLYFEASLGSRLLKSKVALIASTSLVFLGILLLIINGFTHFMYSITDASGNEKFSKLEYKRTSFWGFGLYYLCIYVYVLTSSIRCFIYSKRKENYIESKKFVFFGFVAFTPAIFGFLQLFFDTLPIVCPGLTLSTIIIYVYATNDQVSNDNLTELLNRKRTLSSIERTIRMKTDESIYVVFMLDLNKFKLINDKYGHLEGDKALRYTAEALNKVSSLQKKRMTIGRFGGDEFIIGATLEKEEDIQNIIEQINSTLVKQKEKYNTEYTISTSVGYAIYSDELNNVKDLMDEADKKLYEAKESRKRNSRRK